MLLMRFKAVAIKLSLQSSKRSQNLAFVDEEPVYQYLEIATKEILICPTGWSWTRNRFAFREEVKKQITLSSNFLVGNTRTENQFRVLS